MGTVFTRTGGNGVQFLSTPRAGL